MGLWQKIKDFGDKAAVETTNIVEWLSIASAIGICVFWYFWPPQRFVPHSLFALLAALPGLMGLANHFMSVLPRYRERRDTVADYHRFCAGFDEWWRIEGWPRKLQLSGFAASKQSSDFAPVSLRVMTEDDLQSYRPMTAAALWSSLLLTMVFMVAACIAEDQGSIIGGFPEMIAAVEKPGASSATAGAFRAAIAVNAVNGLLFAALGAFVSVMWRMINRINANALTSRFMFTAALRSAIAITIGLVAGQFDLFDFLKADGAKQSLFFLVGLFTDWALSSLRARARSVFAQPDSACDRLPLCYVDGLDDGVIDILDEIGIWDVQHLATSEPGELALRTLYPFNRIIDWIDQAILISYLRRHIAAARQFGISGAIDLAVMYSYTLEPEKAQLAIKASAALDELCKKTDISRNVLDLVCSSLFFDYSVEQLYRFWQHHYHLRRAE